MKTNLLRAKLAEHQITQGELADKLGISANSMSRKLNGKREFKLSEITGICRILAIGNPQEIFLQD